MSRIKCYNYYSNVLPAVGLHIVAVHVVVTIANINSGIKLSIAHVNTRVIVVDKIYKVNATNDP